MGLNTSIRIGIHINMSIVNVDVVSINVVNINIIIWNIANSNINNISISNINTIAHIFNITINKSIKMYMYIININNTNNRYNDNIYRMNTY